MCRVCFAAFPPLFLLPLLPPFLPRRASSFSERRIERRRVGKKIIDRSLIAAPSVDITTRNIPAWGAEKLIANHSRRRRNHLYQHRAITRYTRGALRNAVHYTSRRYAIAGSIDGRRHD